MKRFDERIQLRLAWLLLGASMLAYSIWIGYESVLRYVIFQATAFDLGNMDQVIWNTLHGRLFQFTNQAIDWYGPPTRLAVHFEPIILPLSLLYALHADPRTLLVFQTLMLALGALPVFLLTRKYIPQWPLLASVMAAGYLFMPALLGINLFDFHPVSLATPLLLFAFLALAYRRFSWLIVFCILAASTKEDIPFAVAMLGLLMIWRYQAPRLGTVIFLGGMLWGLAAFVVIIPHFFPGAQHNNFWYRYSYLGATPSAAIVNLLLHPWLIFSSFITLDRLYYLFNLFRSTGFFGLLAPEWLLPALPSLAVNLLSGDPLLYSGVYHYNAAIIPCVMLAAIHGIRRALLIWQHWRGEGIAGTYGVPLLKNLSYSVRWLFSPVYQMLGEQRMTSLLAFVQSSTRVILTTPVVARSGIALQERVLAAQDKGITQWKHISERVEPLAKQTSLARLQWFAYGWIITMLLLNYILMIPLLNIFWPMHAPGSREQHIEQLLAMIPPDASVSASDNLNPHLTERMYVTVFPQITFATSSKNVNNTVQYVVVDLTYLFPEDRVSATRMLNGLVDSGRFRILARAEGVVLLERRI